MTLEHETSSHELHALAAYLTTLAQCDVVIVDHAARDDVESHRRVLRWVGRYVPIDGEIDIMRMAVDLSRSEKIIVATPEARYTGMAIEAMCELLDRHELVEPEEFVEPLTWWGGIEAGRLLLHRGVHQPAARTTFCFRRSAFHHGAVYTARDVFVRREPREAAGDFEMPLTTAFFLALIPLLLFFALAGGLPLAGECVAAMASASVLVAMRGRSGVAHLFPLRACLFAPLWIAERSVSVYWALLAESGRLARSRRASRPTANEARGRSFAPSGENAS